jgi:uncharacterized protein (DUF433 family)
MATRLNGHIELTPGVRGGNPRVSGSRLTVADIAIMHLRLGQPLEMIAGKYDLPLGAVYAAIVYYHDRRDEIDRSIEEDEAFVQAARADNPSSLQAKLRALSGG